MKKWTCTVVLVVSALFSASSLMSLSPSRFFLLSLFWTRNENPPTKARQRHHNTAVGMNCHHIRFHDDTTKATGSLLSVQQTTLFRASITAGDTERDFHDNALSCNLRSHRRQSKPFAAMPRQTSFVNQSADSAVSSAKKQSVSSFSIHLKILCTRRKLLDLVVSLGVASK